MEDGWDIYGKLVIPRGEIRFVVVRNSNVFGSVT